MKIPRIHVDGIRIEGGNRVSFYVYWNHVNYHHRDANYVISFFSSFGHTTSHIPNSTGDGSIIAVHLYDNTFDALITYLRTLGSSKFLSHLSERINTYLEENNP